MKILSVDTSTTSCSVAVVDNGSLLAEITNDREQTHSKHLMDMIHRVFGFSGLDLSDLDGFAVTKGPGTFTGLRIGISSVKGLAVASGKPLVGVSSLDALAMQAANYPNLICPLLDARRGEVYFSRYRFEDGYLQRVAEEQVFSPEKAVDKLNEPCIFLGNGAVLYRETLLRKLGRFAAFAPPFQNTIRASTVAYLSLKRFKHADTDDVGTFVPYYIRKPDATLSLEVKKESSD
jgi:tRNA threonylcarbamoyladenosine biosynthesis protein TsaB